MGLVGGRPALAALVALGCAAGGVGAARQVAATGIVVERSAPEQAVVEQQGTDAVAPEVEEAPPQHYVVHVDGAVESAGVVELTGSDVRVSDAVDAAGGLAQDADTTSVNLAEPLVDGSKIHIPRVGDAQEMAAEVPVSGQASTSGATGVGSPTVLVNINTATIEELQTLSGVGEATARVIVEDREQNGPFASPEDLMRVSGIGEKKFAKVRDYICV